MSEVLSKRLIDRLNEANADMQRYVGTDDFPYLHGYTYGLDAKPGHVSFNPYTQASYYDPARPNAASDYEMGFKDGSADRESLLNE